MATTSLNAFKIEEPNFVRGSGPDTTLIPASNLPEFLENATLTCPYADIHWFNLEKCPSANGFVYMLQVNASVDILTSSYPFELSIPSSSSPLLLQTDIVTGNLAIGGVDSTYNANQFITIEAQRPGFLAFNLVTKNVLPINTTPSALTLNLNFF